MLFRKPERVLLVSPSNFSVPQLAGKKLIKHVTAADRIFPAMHEIVPDIILFDYEHFSADMERILVRIRANRFYNRIKIYCYKDSPDQYSDNLLRVLGANFLIYKNDLTQTIKLTPIKTDAAPAANTDSFEPIISVFKAKAV